MKTFALTLALLSSTACGLRELPPPSEPTARAIETDDGVDAPKSDQSTVSIDATRGHLKVERVLEHVEVESFGRVSGTYGGAIGISTAAERTEPVCETPCVVNVTRETQQFRLTDLANPLASDVTTVRVGKKPISLIYEPAQASRGRGEGRYIGAWLTSAGFTGAALGGTFMVLSQFDEHQKASFEPGAIGVAAGVTFPFTGGPGTWTLPATVLTDAQVTSLQSGNFYANVHSAAFPGGEVRGQLYLPAKFANLSGAQEVPGNSSAASGIGWLSVNPFTKAVAARTETTGITATNAHAHNAAAGVAGPVVLPQTQTSPGIWTSAPTATLTDALLIALMKGELYLNVHSAAFPGGEIRGQLVFGQ